MRRLKQISIQAAGPESLLDRRVIRTLQMSAEQEDKIDALLPATKRAGVVTINVNGVDKVVEKIDQTWTAALDVLTTEQRSKWKDLIGETLPTAELQKAHARETAAIMGNMNGIQAGFIPAGVVPVVPPGNVPGNALPVVLPQQK